MSSRTHQALTIALVSLLLTICGASIATAEKEPGDFSWGGWVRADYGNGDRYPEADGEDTLGVSQAALVGKWKKGDIEAVVVIGGTNLTADDSDGDGDVGIKDAFIIWNQIGGSNLRLTVGAQPLLFGLKSNGFPGDRSLQPSLEFGGAGGFAASQQAGPSVLLHYVPNDRVTVTGGVFDTSASTAAYFEATGLGGIDGSSLDSNYILQVKLNPHNGDTGFYLFGGVAGRYIGDGIDATKSIFDLGLGYKTEHFDFSIEAIQMDQAFFGSVDDEVYSIAELSYFPRKGIMLYLDYATAKESENETLRAGIEYEISEAFTLKAEFSEDEFGASNTSVSSGDVRLQFVF